MARRKRGLSIGRLTGYGIVAAALVFALRSFGVEIPGLGQLGLPEQGSSPSRPPRDEQREPRDRKNERDAVAPAYLNHTELGVPTDRDASDDLLLKKPQFTISYNRILGCPNWTAWNLNESHFGSTKRTDDFRPDSDLPTGVYRITPNDYRGSGFDRGHLCPSADRTASESDNSATFLMTNMVPQYHELNAGAWEQLESHCRKLAEDGKELYIVAGVVFPASPQVIGTTGKRVAVPSHTYKIVVVTGRGQTAKDITAATDVIAVNMPNEKTVKGSEWQSYKTSVAEIERQTGYTFFSALPETLQKTLKQKR